MIKVLQLFNYILGTTVVAAALISYVNTNKKIPLRIALAIIIAGQLEGFLKFYIKNSPSLSPNDKEKYIEMIDNITSLAFLILLGLAV